MSNEFRHRMSLGFNIVLAVTALALVLQRSSPAPAPEVGPTNLPSESPVSISQPQTLRYPDAAPASDQRRWLVDQLRAMGVPNKVLARVVWADLDWAWNKRGGELSLKTHGDPDTMAAFKAENNLSLDGEMRAALGEEGFRQWDHENMQRESNPGKISLTPAETDAAYDSWKKLQQRELELKRALVKGELDEDEATQAYEKAASDYQEQMKSLLGGERYAKSRGLDDGSAGLRQDLAKANPTDAQFQELLKTQQDWNEQRSAIEKQFQDDQSSATYKEKLKALDDVREQEYRRVLGDQIFEALQKQQDGGYSQMKKYEALWGLDDNSIDSVYGTLKYYQKSVEDYQRRARALESSGQSVDWDAVNRNLQQFADQTQQELQKYLGSDRFNRMAQNGVFQLTPPDMTKHVKPVP